jgi:HEAT repeat protein
LLQKAAVAALGQIADKRAVAPLVEMLRGKDFDLQQAVIRALIQIGSASVEALGVALSDEEEMASVSAANALGAIGGKRAAELLIAAFEDQEGKGEQPKVPEARISRRRAAATALGKIRDARAVLPLVKALQDKDSLLRKAAVLALGQIGDKRAIKPLTAVLEDQDGSIKQAAAEALYKMGCEVLPPQWPRYSEELIGLNSVYVSNPNEFDVRVGIRCGNRGHDFVVPSGGESMFSVPDGSFDIYFQYSSDLLTLFQGDQISLRGNSIEIRIQKVSGGNYHIRKVY